MGGKEGGRGGLRLLGVDGRSGRWGSELGRRETMVSKARPHTQRSTEKAVLFSPPWDDGP